MLGANPQSPATIPRQIEHKARGKFGAVRQGCDLSNTGGRTIRILHAVVEMGLISTYPRSSPGIRFILSRAALPLLCLIAAEFRVPIFHGITHPSPAALAPTSSWLRAELQTFQFARKMALVAQHLVYSVERLKHVCKR